MNTATATATTTTTTLHLLWKQVLLGMSVVCRFVLFGAFGLRLSSTVFGTPSQHESRSKLQQMPKCAGSVKDRLKRPV